MIQIGLKGLQKFLFSCKFDPSIIIHQKRLFLLLHNKKHLNSQWSLRQKIECIEVSFGGKLEF